MRLLKFVCEKDHMILDEAGECPRCQVPLLKQWMYFTCQKHPEIGSDKRGDTCWKCGDLVLQLQVEKVQGLNQNKRPD